MKNLHISEGQIYALQGLAVFVLETAQMAVDEAQPLPPIDEIMAPFLIGLDIPEDDWREACFITYTSMQDFLANDCQEQQQN